MAFQERNGTCGMKPERSGRNLAEKTGTFRAEFSRKIRNGPRFKIK
jgi:hypothetical protein